MVGWLLDTCLLSEFVKQKPLRRVLDWVAAQPEETLFVSVLTIGEIEQGIARLAASDPRSRRLRDWLDNIIFSERAHAWPRYSPLVLKTQSPDTSPEAERVLKDLQRRTPACWRLQLADQMSSTARTLCLSGLRNRHPQADETELRRRFAEIHLGAELAGKIFGSLPSP